VEEDLFKWLANRLLHISGDKNQVCVLSQALFRKAQPFEEASRMSDFRALNALEAMMDAVYVTLQTLFSTVNEFVPSQIIIVRQDQQLFRPAADEKDDETADVRLLVLID
jgi:hypothetical protein